MQNDLTDEIEYNGPCSFLRDDLECADDLFEQRAALFYTPTSEIPPAWIGDGPLRVSLPIPYPTWFEYYELRGYQTPRLWVDLLQRATWKLRWTPYRRAHVTIVRYDICDYGIHTMGGAKALLDALKWRTTGRRDGRMLYYFGAIEDDGPDYLSGCSFTFREVASPAEARCEIQVHSA